MSENEDAYLLPLPDRCAYDVVLARPREHLTVCVIADSVAMAHTVVSLWQRKGDIRGEIFSITKRSSVVLLQCDREDLMVPA